MHKMLSIMHPPMADADIETVSGLPPELFGMVINQLSAEDLANIRLAQPLLLLSGIFRARNFINPTSPATRYLIGNPIPDGPTTGSSMRTAHDGLIDCAYFPGYVAYIERTDGPLPQIRVMSLAQNAGDVPVITFGDVESFTVLHHGVVARAGNGQIWGIDFTQPQPVLKVLDENVDEMGSIKDAGKHGAYYESDTHIVLINFSVSPPKKLRLEKSEICQSDQRISRIEFDQNDWYAYLDSQQGSSIVRLNVFGEKVDERTVGAARVLMVLGGQIVSFGVTPRGRYYLTWQPWADGSDPTTTQCPIEPTRLLPPGCGPEGQVVFFGRASGSYYATHIVVASPDSVRVMPLCLVYPEGDVALLTYTQARVHRGAVAMVTDFLPATERYVVTLNLEEMAPVYAQRIMGARAIASLFRCGSRVNPYTPGQIRLIWGIAGAVVGFAVGIPLAATFPTTSFGIPAEEVLGRFFGLLFGTPVVGAVSWAAVSIPMVRRVSPALQSLSRWIIRHSFPPLPQNPDSPV